MKRKIKFWTQSGLKKRERIDWSPKMFVKSILGFGIGNKIKYMSNFLNKIDKISRNSISEGLKKCLIGYLNYFPIAHPSNAEVIIKKFSQDLTRRTSKVL
jgi:hypothetical protein